LLAVRPAAAEAFGSRLHLMYAGAGSLPRQARSLFVPTKKSAKNVRIALLVALFLSPSGLVISLWSMADFALASEGAQPIEIESSTPAMGDSNIRKRRQEIRGLMARNLTMRGPRHAPWGLTVDAAAVKAAVSEKDIPALVELLGDDDSAIKAGALNVLRFFGPQAIPYVESASKNLANPEAKDRANMLLGELRQVQKPR
jgi:hypothetical protein